MNHRGAGSPLAFAASTLVMASALSSCTRRPHEPIHVLAAASLREALSNIGREFQGSAHVPVTFSFGASSALAAQIRAGAPADVFISADEAQMDTIARVGLLDVSSRFDLLANRLVVVVRADAAIHLATPDDLRHAEVRRIAVADPSGVPAGIYAIQFLDAAKLRTDVESRLVRCNDVRGALAAVESGEADCGFVYRTDAVISTKVRVAFEISGANAPSIRYPAARILGGPNSDGADQLLRFLRTDTATRIFAESGFVLPT
ncbi:MAG: molybdate ABC transporter substrate-binding protein [Planctomycetes bacterium]|nr:molybdate ABC transporter substrate-binding protein [Planctomycetota bacterium]MBI3846519.1 molybdate ABC transporter substrate-binding protein [Planctomycetota bacterium]